MAHRVTFIPGDGTGPELSRRRGACSRPPASSSSGTAQDAGVDVYERGGHAAARPHARVDPRSAASPSRARSRRRSGSGFRIVNVALRKELDLYACLRPCKAYEGVRTRFPETDIVIVRENTEDLYAGIEFEKGSDEAEKLREFIADELDGHRDPRGLRHLDQADLRSSAPSGSCARPSSTRSDNGRKKVTAAHKANIMKFSDGLFLRGRARGGRGAIRTSSSRTGSSTTSATSSCRGPRSTT